MAAAPPPVPNDIIADWIGTFRWSLSNVALYTWEYFITFDDEVEYIWKRKLNMVSVLYLLNRYVLLFGNVVLALITLNVNNFFDPSGSHCQHAGHFDAALSCIVVTLSEALMTLRVYALYEHNAFVLIILSLLICGQVAWYAFIDIGGAPAPFPAPLDECVLAGDLKLGIWAESSGLPPLIFDTAVLFFTLLRARTLNRNMPTIQLLVRDGIVYFGIIFSSNFAWVMMTFFAPIQFQQTLALWCETITVIMVSRLIINLRKLATSPVWRTPQFTLSFSQPASGKFGSFRSSTLVSSGQGKNAREDNGFPLQVLSHAATGGSFTEDDDDFTSHGTVNIVHRSHHEV